MPFSNPARIALAALVASLLAALSIVSISAASPRAAAAHACAKRGDRAAVRRCRLHLRTGSRDTTAPTVAWKVPAVGATIEGKLQGSACEVSASDNRGVAKVVFRVDGKALNTESDAPWNCSFDTSQVSDGTHTVTATAYDAAGNSRGASLSVNVADGPASSSSSTPAPTASPTPTPTTEPRETSPAPAPEPTPAPAPTQSGDTTAPTVAWKVPAVGATIKGKLQGSACEVSASDSGGIEEVVFKVDGTKLNTESDTPWNCIFDTSQVSNGSHTVTATAYDAAGNSSSAARSFTVSNSTAPAPAGSPEPTPPPPPATTGMIVGLDAGNYGSAGATDVRGAVNTVRFDTDLGVKALENFKKAGLRIQMNFSGPYNSGGVCALNASAWASETLAFYKANTDPAQTPVIEALNEPGGTWFWGSGANSSANGACYRELLKKTHDAFHATYGEAAPKILGTLDGSNGLSFGKAWFTSDWRTYVDGFIVHPYGGTGSKTSSALGNRALVESAHAMTGGPIYITEVGWPTATGQPATGDSLQWPEAEQASNITNFIAWAHDTGYVGEVVYFNYRDYGTNAWYGVVRNDGSHKPAYEALRQAAAKYGV